MKIFRFDDSTGQAAFWEADEKHETRTGDGLAAVVIEGKNLDPAQLMPELEIILSS